MENKKYQIEKEIKSCANFLKRTTYGGNLLYTFHKRNCPNLMLEVGRLREETFSKHGGGSGKEYDIDDFDELFWQLIVWNEEKKEILGGYRYFLLNNATIETPTMRLFDFSEIFIRDYMKNTLELGRSFVAHAYQVAHTKEAVFILDNLWEGLGALVNQDKRIKYFFGKVTMYRTIPQKAREMIIFFMKKYFNSQLVKPKKEFEITLQYKNEIAKTLNGDNQQQDWKILQNKLKEQGIRIPPLFTAYINLSPTMKYFGTALNPHFGMVEESAILITIKEIYQKKLERYLYNQ